MPISAGIRAPPHGASVSLPGRRFRVHPPASVAAGGVRRRRLGVVVAAASSAASPDELHARGRHLHGFPEESSLWNLIKDVEPLDLSVVQRDVPPETVDAMKRTVSGMLGLLPSDQFSVVVEALWDPFFKLVISSIMTGYTLCNAEYRLSLERTLELSDDETECKERYNTEHDHSDLDLGGPMAGLRLSEDDELTYESEKKDDKLFPEKGGLEDLNAQAKEHILQLQSRLDSMEKELHELKRKNSSLQMQQLTGEDKNELLNYLRSLSPDTVIELSEPSCTGVQEAIHSVVHGLLATLSPKMHAKPPPPSENMAGGTLNYGNGDDDRAELVEDVSLPFQLLPSPCGHRNVLAVHLWPRRTRICELLFSVATKARNGQVPCGVAGTACEVTSSGVWTLSCNARRPELTTHRKRPRPAPQSPSLSPSPHRSSSSRAERVDPGVRGGDEGMGDLLACSPD